MLATEREPEEFGVEEQDGGGNDPGDGGSEGELAKAPIYLSLVNFTSGMTANGNWKLSTTWLRMSSEVTLPSP